MCPWSDKISEANVAESTHGGTTKMEQSPFSAAASCSGRQGISGIFMEHELPLLCSQVPASYPYPELDQSSPGTLILFL